MQMKTKRNAFTLVELLIVITIIGVLVGLIIPGVSRTQITALKATSSAFLKSMGTALEQYKTEYGYFPDFLTERERTNLNDGSYSDSMVKALTGKDPDGNSLTQSDRKTFNRRARLFMTFDNNNLKKANPTAPWKIIDSFENPNIYICVDGDGDGFINQGFPTTTDGLSEDTEKELVPNPQRGVRSGVILFTLKKDSMAAGANFMSEDVFSWQ